MMKAASGNRFVLQSLFFDVAARNVQFSRRAHSHVDPVRNKKHGNGDLNDHHVAKTDRAGRQERDRRIHEGEKEIRKESRRNTDTG